MATDRHAYSQCLFHFPDEYYTDSYCYKIKNLKFIEIPRSILGEVFLKNLNNKKIIISFKNNFFTKLEIHFFF